MQKNPIAVEAIGFFCSIGKLVLVEGFRQVGQIVFSWQRGECLSHGRDEPLGGGVFPEDLFHFFQIVDFKFNRFASGSSVVTSDKVFASRFSALSRLRQFLHLWRPENLFASSLCELLPESSGCSKLYSR